MNEKTRAPYPLILLLSSPRAGSHLLERLLLEHFGVAFPLLTHLVSLFDNFKWLWGDLSRPSNRHRLLKAMYQYETLRIKIYSLTGIDYDAALKSSLLCTHPFSKDIVAKSSDFSSLVSQAHQKFAMIHNGIRWGYNAGFYSCPDMESMPDVFEETKIIHVVRDGRDVALSWTGVYYGPYNIAESARIWSGHVKGYSLWGAKNSDRYHQVRYEDILDDPSSELNKIEDFLGISSLPNKIDTSNSPLVKASASQGTHKLVGMPVQKNNKEKWKKKFSTREITLFDILAGDTLKQFGYSFNSKQFHRKDIFLAKTSQIVGRLRGIVSPVQISKLIRAFLPIFFFIFGKFCSIPKVPFPPDTDTS
jgi:hypothetical protein